MTDEDLAAFELRARNAEAGDDDSWLVADVLDLVREVRRLRALAKEAAERAHSYIDTNATSGELSVSAWEMYNVVAVALELPERDW